jgi:ParB family chromosome partitioning protein
VRPNPFQPRKQFDQQKLVELGDSIETHGLLEPLVVRESSDGYFELACGERRWRAMQLKHIPEADAIILDKDCTDEEMEQVAIIENVQRENLSPMELALAYDRLRKDGAHGTTRSISEVATIVHQSKSVVDDHLAILRAPEDVRQLILDTPDIPLRVVRDLSNIESVEDRAYLVSEFRSGGLTSNAITRILQQLKRTQREDAVIITAPTTTPAVERQSANHQNGQSVAEAVRTDQEQIANVEEEAPRPRRAVSSAIALATLEQKLLRDGKHVQKIAQRLTEDVVYMTSEEKQRVHENVDQWHRWIQQILDMIHE